MYPASAVWRDRHRLSTFHHYAPDGVRSISSPAAAVWTEIERIAGRRPCARADGRGLLPISPQASRAAMPHAHRQQLLPSASGFRRHRRDADHRRARGDRAIHQDAAGRTCLSAGAHAEAARPRAGRDRGIARHRALYAAGGRSGRAAGEELPRAQRCPACRFWDRCCSSCSPISAPRPAIASAPSTCSMPNISSASTRSTTPCCMTTASIPKISRMPMSCWSACRAPRRRRPRSISPTAA